MFFGTTPVPIANYVFGEFSRQQPSKVIEPYAGNFVVSQLASKAVQDVKILSSDVSLYSCAIGYAINDEDAGIRFTDEAKMRFRFAEAAQTPLEIAAGTIVLCEAIQAINKSKIRYYATIVRDIELNQDKYYQKMLGVVTKLKAEMSRNFRYIGQDGARTIEAAGPDTFVYFDPPYFKGDYEKMWKGIEMLVTMPEIPYTLITEQEKARQIEMLLNSGCELIYRTQAEKVNGMRRVFQYNQGRSKTHYLYANYKAKPGIKLNTALRTVSGKFKVLNEMNELTGKESARIVPIDSKVSNYYRVLWTKKAKMTDMGKPYGLFLDDVFVACITISSGLKFAMDYALIVSDCVPPGSKYKKLSRLPLLCILSEEFKNYVNGEMMWEHNGFSTIAFSNEPVSMKYRGLFDLAERKPNTDNEYKFKLTYRQRRMFNPTVQKAYEEWFTKYGQDKN